MRGGEERCSKTGQRIGKEDFIVQRRDGIEKNKREGEKRKDEKNKQKL